MGRLKELASLQSEVEALEAELKRRQAVYMRHWFRVLSDNDLEALKAASELSEAERETSPAYQRALFISDKQKEIADSGGTPADLEAALYPDLIAEREAAAEREKQAQFEKWHAYYLDGYITRRSWWRSAEQWLHNNGFEHELNSSPLAPKVEPVQPTTTPTPEPEQPAVEPTPKAPTPTPEARLACKRCGGNTLAPKKSDPTTQMCHYCGWEPGQDVGLKPALRMNF